MKKTVRALLVVVGMTVVLVGCGYKAPPYYEKTPPKEGSTGAL